MAISQANFLYISVVRKTDNVPSRLLPIRQWPMVTHALMHLGSLSVFLTTYIYYAHLTSVGFEHSVCHESLLTSFIYIYTYIDR